jgi:hypothetical protein
MKCPLSGQRRCIHAREHGELSEGRSGAGDEGAGSDLASDGEEDQLVAGARDPRHQRAAHAAVAGAYEAHDYDGLIDRLWPAQRKADTVALAEQGLGLTGRGIST